LQDEIEALNAIIFEDINNSVYKSGFAKSQEASEDAFDGVFARLDELDGRLSTTRYLFGDSLTDRDKVCPDWQASTLSQYFSVD
jgi:putative glutathione S-transferase